VEMAIEVRDGRMTVDFTGSDAQVVGPFNCGDAITISACRLLIKCLTTPDDPVDEGCFRPLRVIVPGWYAVADVKWLVDVEVVGNSFSGHFQTSRYIYEWERAGVVAREPVRRQRVRALITEPTSGDLLNAGALAVRGLAWSGVAPVARVEVSVNGEAWRAARLLGHPCGHCWQRWELTVRAGRPGWTTIRARATDAAGRTQPGRAEWNRLGYGINPIQEVSVRVE